MVVNMIYRYPQGNFEFPLGEIDDEESVEEEDVNNQEIESDE